MASKRRINYHWRLFLPIATSLCIVFGFLIFYQYHREADYRAKVFNAELDMIDSRILDAYRQDVNLRSFLSFIQQFFQGSMFEGVRISVYRDDLLYYSLGVPIPLELDDEKFKQTSTTVGSIDGVDGIRMIGRDEDSKLYFFSKVKSEDGLVTVCTAMPYSASVHDIIDIDSSVWVVILLSLMFTQSTAIMSAPLSSRVMVEMSLRRAVRRSTFESILSRKRVRVSASMSGSPRIDSR